MGAWSDAVLLVTLYDVEDVDSNNKSNVDKLNEWLAVEYPTTKPKFELTKSRGVFTTQIRDMNMEELVEKFRSIPWFEPDISQLMICKDGENRWRTFNIE